MLKCNVMNELPELIKAMILSMELCIEITTKCFTEMNKKDSLSIPIIDDEVIRELNSKEGSIEEITYKHGRLNDCYERRVFTYLLLDYNIFCSKSLQALKEGLPSVACALARKPFNDTLHYLERFFISPIDTVKLIHDGTDSEKDINKEDKENIYNQVIASKNMSMYSDVQIFRDRYDNKELSVKGLGDLANHIVTKRRGIETPKGALNFVFLSSEVVLNKTIESVICTYSVYDYATKLIIEICKKGYIEETMITDIEEKYKSIDGIMMSAFNIEELVK